MRVLKGWKQIAFVWTVGYLSKIEKIITLNINSKVGKMKIIKLFLTLFMMLPMFANAQSISPQSSYFAELSNLIRSNAMFDSTSSVVENDPSIYRITLDDKGFIKSLSLIKSSSVIGFDDAISKAIQRSQPFPKDENGIIPKTIELLYYPNDKK